MKTLKVDQVYLAGYETVADVAAQLPRLIEEVDNAAASIHQHASRRLSSATKKYAASAANEVTSNAIAQ